MAELNGSERYAINGPNVVAEDFDGQIVILNLADGRYFSLGGTAAPIWSRLLEGRTPDQVIASIASQRPKIVDAARAFIAKLQELRLICVSDSPAVGGELAEPWTGAVPALEMFDDLAELIAADPIHDVDEEAGWPVPKSAA